MQLLSRQPGRFSTKCIPQNQLPAGSFTDTRNWSLPQTSWTVTLGMAICKEQRQFCQFCEENRLRPGSQQLGLRPKGCRAEQVCRPGGLLLRELVVPSGGGEGFCGGAGTELTSRQKEQGEASTALSWDQRLLYDLGFTQWNLIKPLCSQLWSGPTNSTLWCYWL